MLQLQLNMKRAFFISLMEGLRKSRRKQMVLVTWKGSTARGEPNERRFGQAANSTFYSQERMNARPENKTLDAVS